VHFKKVAYHIGSKSTQWEVVIGEKAASSPPGMGAVHPEKRKI
jgi:hypothetical protein